MSKYKPHTPNAKYRTASSKSEGPLRILFLLPHLPYPPHAGGTLRSYGMIEGLVRHGHQVGLLTFADADQLPIEETPLASLCSPVVSVPAPVRTTQDRLRDLLAGHADMARRFWSGAFAEALRVLLNNQTFDVIDLYIEMADYLPIVNLCAPSAMLIYDALNAEYYLQKRIAVRDLHTPARWPLAAYSFVQSRRLARVEASLCRSVQHVLACSRTDAELLGVLRHTTPITVIPNAISVKDYQGTTGQPPADIIHPALVLTGKMDFRPNVDAALWFANDIMPIIRLYHPDVHFTIVGQKPHPRLARLKDRQEVTVTGYVPDIKPYLAAADIYVAPLRMGSGTRFKLLEAMAMGKAIVSTPLGAEGLNVEHGRHMLLADTERSFAGAIIDLLSNENRRRDLGENAARLVREYYDWGTIIPQIERVYRRDK
jgi:sugar transferase (PEP-CTERM/EpsH1 system associated)